MLFGSHARGDAGPSSDVNLLVVERSVTSRRAEMGRLQRAVSHHRIPRDILVTTEDLWRRWRDIPGTVLFEAGHEGEVLYERAA